MFCPNCGEKLESPNQRFCASCGSEIQTNLSPEAPQIPPKRIQVPPVAPVPPVPPVPIYQAKPSKAEGIGTNSKICFSFSLVAIAFFVAGLSFGAGVIIRLLIPIYFIPYLPGGPGMWIIAFVLHVVGLIFGIISRANSSKARRREADNALQKVGSVFGVFGIVLNVLPLVIIPIAIVLASMTFYYPYPYM